MLVSFSRSKPLVVAVEDLHWMDKTSEEFLTYFIDKLAHGPILLILLYRTEYTHQWGSKSYYTKVGLDQLTTESSAELISTILEGSEVESDLKQLIVNRAAGHPLFMEEFTHSLREDGLIERQDDRFILSRKFKDVQVPDSIQGIIASRMDRLDENLKQTLQVASVVGRDFAFRILQAVSGMQEELKAHLLSLQGLEFIYEKQLSPELEYIFKHVLTQEVAYQSLLLKKRKKLHERIGQAIEQIYADRLEACYEILAHHYARSRNFDKAFQYLKRSGCEKGNLAATAINDARTLGMCEYLLGAVLQFNGELKPAKVHFESAIKYNENLKHTPSLPHSYNWLGLASGLAGDSATGCRLAEKGLKIQSDTGYNYLGSIGWFCLGACLAESGEFEATGRKLEKGLGISRENHERVTEGVILIWLGRILGQSLAPQNDRAAESLLQGIEISKELSQRPDEAVGYLFLAELYANQGRKDLALEHLNKSMAQFEEMEMQYWPAKAQKIFARLHY